MLFSHRVDGKVWWDSRISGISMNLAAIECDGIWTLPLMLWCLMQECMCIYIYHTVPNNADVQFQSFVLFARLYHQQFASRQQQKNIQTWHGIWCDPTQSRCFSMSVTVAARFQTAILFFCIADLANIVSWLKNFRFMIGDWSCRFVAMETWPTTKAPRKTHKKKGDGHGDGWRN